MITDVYCYYTGGGVYIYSARFGDNYLYGSLDQTIDCYRGARGEVLFRDEDVCKAYCWLDEMNSFQLIGSEDDYYIHPDEIEYPTWQEILDSLRLSENVDLEADRSLLYWNPDLTKRTCEE